MKNKQKSKTVIKIKPNAKCPICGSKVIKYNHLNPESLFKEQTNK